VLGKGKAKSPETVEKRGKKIASRRSETTFKTFTGKQLMRAGRVLIHSPKEKKEPHKIVEKKEETFEWFEQHK